MYIPFKAMNTQREWERLYKKYGREKVLNAANNLVCGCVICTARLLEGREKE